MIRGVPRPLPDLDTQAFWDGCREGRFLIPHCESCGKNRWPPGPMCPFCQSTETSWLESAGRGTLYSWVVVVHPPDPVLADQVPYVVGLVDLEEGVRVVGDVLECPADAVRAGMLLELQFEDDEGLRLPNFRPCGGRPDPPGQTAAGPDPATAGSRPAGTVDSAGRSSTRRPDS